MKYWLILAVTLSAGFVAQDILADDQLGPASGTNAPSEQPVKKRKLFPAKKPAAAPKKSTAAAEPMKPAPLVKGPAVVSQKNQTTVNVRGQPSINSEVVARLKRGDHITVLDVIDKKGKDDEPGKWAKVSLPTNATLWVNGTFINTADKTVVPKKLKVRTGPGENYSVVDIISKGTVVKEIESKGDWMKIEPPAEAYGFVAAHLLANEPAAAPPLIVASVEPPRVISPPVIPPPTETKVATPIIPATPTEPVVPVVPTPTPTVPPPVIPPPTVPAPVTPTLPKVDAEPPASITPTPAAPTPPAEEILVKRVVSREGIVKGTVSIQAPTYFALRSLDTGKTINYLYSPSTNVVLKDLLGKRIVVTGEELLDERWPNTPVINVESLQTVP